MQTELIPREEVTVGLCEGYRIAKRAFPEESPEELFKLLLLCQRNNGLLVAPTSGVLAAWFRYNPFDQVGDVKLLDIVTNYDYDTLKALDLRAGDIVHMVGFVSPMRGFRLFRQIVDGLNPKGVSAHRYKHGTRSRYFVLRQNVRWHDDSYDA